MIRDIITTIIFIALLFTICYTNQNRTRLDVAEDRRVIQNEEMLRFQKDVSRLDTRLTRNEMKTKVLENKEIILLSKDVLKKFEKDIEAFETAIRNHEGRLGK